MPLPPSMHRTTVHVPAGVNSPFVRVTSQLPICSHIDWEDEAGVIPCTEFAASAYDMAGKFVNATVSGGTGATLRLPEGAGDYILVVEQGFLGNMPAGQDSETYTVTTYLPGAPGTTDGRLVIAPKDPVARPGQTVNLAVRWSGLVPGRRYIGHLVLSNGSGQLKTLPITIQS
ncbi:hypothetical protein ACFQZ4_43855 [Catellatospora coxensis]